MNLNKQIKFYCAYNCPIGFSECKNHCSPDCKHVIKFLDSITGCEDVCSDCGSTGAKERFDNGLSVGVMCSDCFTKMVQECRKQSW